MTGSRSSSAGFTLLELTVVLLIVGLAASLAVPALDAVLSVPPGQEALGVVAAALQAARREAVETGESAAVSIGAGGRALDGDKRNTVLPAGARVAGEPPRIVFHPTGLSSGGRWRVLLDNRIVGAVVVSPIGGSIETRLVDD